MAVFTPTVTIPDVALPFIEEALADRGWDNTTPIEDFLLNMFMNYLVELISQQKAVKLKDAANVAVAADIEKARSDINVAFSNDVPVPVDPVPSVTPVGPVPIVKQSLA
jgi:hypothetical protein